MTKLPTDVWHYIVDIIIPNKMKTMGHGQLIIMLNILLKTVKKLDVFIEIL